MLPWWPNLVLAQPWLHTILQRCKKCFNLPIPPLPGPLWAYSNLCQLFSWQGHRLLVLPLKSMLLTSPQLFPPHLIQGPITYGLQALSGRFFASLNGLWAHTCSSQRAAPLLAWHLGQPPAPHLLHHCMDFPCAKHVLYYWAAIHP